MYKFCRKMEWLKILDDNDMIFKVNYNDQRGQCNFNAKCSVCFELILWILKE